MSDDVTDDEPIRDSGLAAERTELAWGRSTLALFACGAAIAKGFPVATGMSARPAIGAALFVVGVIVWLAGVPYARVHRVGAAGRSIASGRVVASFAGGTALVGVTAFWIVLLFPT